MIFKTQILETENNQMDDDILIPNVKMKVGNITFISFSFSNPVYRIKIMFWRQKNCDSIKCADPQQMVQTTNKSCLP